MQMHGQFPSGWVHCSPKQKDFQYTDMLFPFIHGHVEKSAGYSERAKLTRLNKIYSTLLPELYFRRSERKEDFQECIL